MSLSLFALYFWLASALIASLLLASAEMFIRFRVFSVFRGLSFRAFFRVFRVFRGLKFWLLCLGVLILFLRSCLRGS
jgi:hypothetical protein